jgi:hypothetical protein
MLKVHILGICSHYNSETLRTFFIQNNANGLYECCR